MFKVGDMVECVDNNNGKHCITIGKIYEVASAVPLYTRITNDKGYTGGYEHKHFKLATSQPAINAINKFKIGDIIEYSLIKNECTLRVESIDFTSKMYHTHVIFSRDKTYENTKFSLHFNAAETGYVLVNSPKVNSNTAPIHKELKPCTCESLVLFRKGCQCGAIVKQQWRLRG